MRQGGGSIHKGAVGMLLSSAMIWGCTVGDPGYNVALKNDSDARLVVRVAGPNHAGGPRAWVLPPHAAGWALSTLGPPREASPITYEIVDEETCAVIGIQRVDFALAPDPGYSQFIVVVGADRSLRVDARTSADPTIDANLEETASCPTA
jgi:hypothetical protein